MNTELKDASWSVWRQDDNGNLFCIAKKLSEEEAEKVVRDFEAKGHKQTFWVRREDPVNY